VTGVLPPFCAPCTPLAALSPILHASPRHCIDAIDTLNGWLAGTLDVRQGYCRLQGFQGHYCERFPSGGHQEATIIALSITPFPPPADHR
jgi:hypothetical protein